MNDYFDCPVTWCAGYRPDHGAEGDAPDQWMHADRGTSIGGEAVIWRHQENGRDSYSLVIGPALVVDDASSPAEVVDALRDWAAGAERYAQRG